MRFYICMHNKLNVGIPEINKLKINGPVFM